jgi:hypothetical protein
MLALDQWKPALIESRVLSRFEKVSCALYFTCSQITGCLWPESSRSVAVGANNLLGMRELPKLKSGLETIDRLIQSESAVRYQAHRATLFVAPRLELASQSDDFILRRRTMRLARRFEKGGKELGSSRSGNSRLRSGLETKAAAQKDGHSCVGKLF